MLEPDAAVLAAALTEDPPRRKPWQAPEIEDVSVAMKTAKLSSSTEYGTGKNGS